MTDLGAGAWLAFLMSVPILASCFLLDWKLRGRPAMARRRLWIAGIVGSLLLSGLAFGLLQTPDPTRYWETTSESSVATLGGAIDLTRQALTDVLPATPLSNSSHLTDAVTRFQQIYLIVLAGLLLRLAGSTWAARQYVERAVPLDDDRLHGRCHDLIALLQLRQPVRLLWHHGEHSPAVVGLRRGVILLPRTARGWTAEQRDCVLLHELAHVQHRDNFWRLLTVLVCSLQWFNPLAWLAARRLRETSEMAADDLASGNLGRPEDYATNLVEVIRSLRPLHLPLASTANHALGKRIDHLLSCEGELSRLVAAVVLGIVLTCGMATAAFATMNYSAPTGIGRWVPQQFRWESSATANGLFLHGDLDLSPGKLDVGRDGFLLMVREDSAALETCVAWRDRGLEPRFECNHGVEPQRWIDERLAEAAARWPRDTESPLAAYGQLRGPSGFAASRITGLPGRSQNPNRKIFQVGWIDDDGARVGVIRRTEAFAVAFRFVPGTQELRWMQQAQGSQVLSYRRGGWHVAASDEKRWFNEVIRVG